MLGGLYGDLPPPSADDGKPNPNPTTAWSTSKTLMAPPNLRKPPSSSATTMAPLQTLLRSQPKPSSKPQNPAPKPHVDAAAQLPPAPPHPVALVGVNAVVVEEYDPARPNDYEEYRREKKRKAAEAERARELERRRKEEEERERAEREQRERDRDRDANVSGEEAWRRRAAMSTGGGPPLSPPYTSNGNGFSIGKSETSGLGVGAGGQMTAAQRMMAKMGWKEGQGLGKQEQGITTPLMAKKTDRRAGVIVNASSAETNKTEKKVKSVSFNGPPTRVLLLRNMVGPGEVDDDLEEEVGSECSKYGTVMRVLIFEITEPNFPREEAVRIFIQFERSEQATKAYVDLDGRFFGGNVVRASFYDEEKFSKNELAPMPGEIPGF